MKSEKYVKNMKVNKNGSEIGRWVRRGRGSGRWVRRGREGPLMWRLTGGEAHFCVIGKQLGP